MRPNASANNVTSLKADAEEHKPLIMSAQHKASFNFTCDHPLHRLSCCVWQDLPKVEDRFFRQHWPMLKQAPALS